ncbi:hypothetical protein F0M18_06225 [Pseudohalioglobus sediminis]|uniref:Uncharacterized protein n=1 Tax=Pseudohalioglobus sediminis TaxID=2606449 RepID=A0A5B0X476_9GAMM|nr:hypothetical protein [Pseudohalioglobus sediminis]KAA1193428.1 hypothetical protein F0M18_06225 [Pseudohalioglobus sediminis]
MKIFSIVVSMSLMLATYASAQESNHITCKSIVEPTNVKVFAGENCPFGWVPIRSESPSDQEG